MRPLSVIVTAAAALWLVVAPAAAQEPTLSTANGVVLKASKDTLAVRPRGADGRFEKEMTLMLTGTTKITSVSMQTRAGRTVPVQQDVDAKDLKAQQTIAMIYTQGASGPVLLAAVVLPAAK
jgi:hypothetical protein